MNEQSVFRVDKAVRKGNGIVLETQEAEGAILKPESH